MSPNIEIPINDLILAEDTSTLKGSRGPNSKAKISKRDFPQSVKDAIGY